MPAIVGIAQVNAIGTSSVFNIGDVYKIMPIASVKTFAGAGSFNTGDVLEVHNNYSSTNTFDQDVADQSILFNN
ncbi:spore germination protein [Robertmurraya massiliosenegalensis]|uniref:spore germination protein n=1 Tax=Robertmurraya massiliosenegalensis TaxID=1287657 RepID=UPI0003136BBE|nr:spore germination protein [Robertmurraya massiliosenegalensis]